jgi:RNAse (barnase) inhibitor barstar
MQEIQLDGTAWNTEDDFFTAFLSAVRTPDWHGHNLDALNDSIGAGDINEVNPPFLVKIRGSASMKPEAKQMVERFQQLIQDLKREGINVAIQVE